MARIRAWLAIYLTLMLLISPTASVFADGPIPLRDQGNNLDGHPWDDGTGDSATDPGNDPNTPGEDPSAGASGTTSGSPAVTSGSGALAIAKFVKVVLEKWVFTGEMKAVKGRTVQRVR